MKIDREEDLDEFLKGFADCIEELHDTFQRQKKHKCDVEEDAYAESLKKDYNECHEWAFGGEDRISSKVQGRNIWEKLHPNLPIPRILKTECEVSDFFGAISMLMDVYPLWLEHKINQRLK